MLLRRNVTTFTNRRRGRKFSEAAVLQMLFFMLGVIFVLYISLMLVIAINTNSFHTPLQGPANTIFGISNVRESQSELDLKIPSNSKINENQFIQESADIQLKENTDQSKRNVIINEISSHTTLKAYIEPIDQNSWDIRPLPNRTHKAKDLKVLSFPKVSFCSRLTEQWPVDNYPEEDPFLPWIHDVFPTNDGKFIQFIAQNRRRCDTGTNDKDRKTIMWRQPQLSLFQHVPLQRLENGRYKLSSHEKADPDGKESRFICRFKPGGEETLSRFNFNYDYVSFRKRHKATFTKIGKWDVKSLHTSQLLFQCPVPEHLQEKIRDGSSVVNDIATLFVDIVPVRTPPRYGSPNSFLPPRYSEFVNKTAELDILEQWGDHVLPKIEDSGRWENIPICKPSIMTYGKEHDSLKRRENKSHRLISCVWASSGYSTRGERFGIHDGHRRLREWLHYVFLTGFDHVYVYDNSGGNSNKTSLKVVTDDFKGKVTRLVWPSKVCNNNRNFADSPGERSSQYAAESSCRLRFGPHAEWIGQFDVDEYLAPMGDYATVPKLLDQLDKEGKKIISFGSWRAWPRKQLIEEPIPINNRSICESTRTCFQLKVPENNTMLQTYNCDRQNGLKKDKMPAEKQLYRSDYVKLHFVHYSTVTNLTLMNKQETIDFGQEWRIGIHADPLSRFGNEQTEGTMLHTKAIATQDTAGWLEVCKKGSQSLCRIGNPYPKGAEDVAEATDKENW
eukprot:CAMPEP_0194178436 /NCGR_PEP_ID=MMETSP0154-20130528/12041_1 /TAXON_ID=1049557 /ORGANISM="Thalassiothrix antarctica, Strain L6-D1" /LENGTH=729 /DNA_ID=CAMNT_0038893391 /DNA_START=14 /DNA_END=2200 /DNA_ORIENTATION=-